MKTILVPTDYSVSSKKAAYYAAQLASATKANLILFHAYHILMPTTINEVPIPIFSYEEIEKENMLKLQSLANEIKSLIKDDVDINLLTRPGFAVEEIEKITKETNIDLIVMGISEANKFTEIFIGSNTTDVARKVHCPVLILHEDVNYKPINKIVFAFDSGDISNQSLFNPIKELVKIFNAKVLVLNIVKHSEEADKEKRESFLGFEEYFSDIFYSIFFLEEDNIIEGINRFVKEHSADLLIMIPRKHRLLHKIFVESYVKKMAFHIHLPLLILHDLN